MLISKLDAARRQLDTAIALYFNDGDPVAIHTLAAAAFEVVTGLREHAGQPDELIELIVPEFRDEFRRMWRASQNFLKHADRDPEATIELDTSLTETMLFLGAQRYAAIDRKTVPMTAMIGWFCVQHPDLLLDTPDGRQMREMAARSNYRDRLSFWRNIHSAAGDMGSL